MRKRKKRRRRTATATATATSSIGNKGDAAKATTAREIEGGQQHRICNVSFFSCYTYQHQTRDPLGRERGR